jgi:hypothetical protein
MNALNKAGTLAALIGLLALGTFTFSLDSDADARSQNTTGDTATQCSSPCSADMSRFAYPVGDGLVILMLDDFS